MSTYDALGEPQEYAEWNLKNAGDDSGAFAITDHGNMNNIGSIVALQKRYKQKGVPQKIIYGAELYFLPSLLEWEKLKHQQDEEKKQEKANKKQQPKDTDADTDLLIENEAESKDNKYFDPINRRNHLVVVAQNQVGLQNLYRLVSRSYKQGFYRKPRVDTAMLRELNEGLIVSTACLHPDTIIKTSYGERSIKEIVEFIKNGKEIFVLGFDLVTQRAVFRKIIWADKTRENSKLIKVKLKNGKELKLTSDHKVYTDKGWIVAGNLTQEYKILQLG